MKKREEIIMIAQYLGFDSDYVIIGLAALVVILMILMIVNVVQMSKLKKNYKIFMTGKKCKDAGGYVDQTSGSGR